VRHDDLCPDLGCDPLCTEGDVAVEVRGPGKGVAKRDEQGRIIGSLESPGRTKIVKAFRQKIRDISNGGYDYIVILDRIARGVDGATNLDRQRSIKLLLDYAGFKVTVRAKVTHDGEVGHAHAHVHAVEPGQLERLLSLTPTELERIHDATRLLEPPRPPGGHGEQPAAEGDDRGGVGEEEP